MWLRYRSRIIEAAVLVLMLALFVSPNGAVAADMPCRFLGSVTIDGQPAEKGTTIRVWLQEGGNTTWEREIETGTNPAGQPIPDDVYLLDVPAADPPDPGAEEGDTVYFSVEGIPAQTGTWARGEFVGHALTVTTPTEPAVALDPSSLSFSAIQAGQCSGTFSFTLQNIGGGTATGTMSLTGPNADQFQITSGSGSFSLGAGATQPISVRFCPTSTGAKSASLFAAGSNCNDDTSSLSGNGVAAPQIELTPPSYSFSDIQVGQCSGTYSFTLQNIGGGTATGSVSLTGANADQFEITSGSGSFSLGAGATQPISVRFCPTSTGAKSASLFAAGSNCNDDTSSLSGNGVAAPQIELSPPSYSFGDIQVGQCSGTYSFTLQNIGGGTAAGTVSLTGANADQFEITLGSGSFSLGAGATQPISVRFCPTSTGAKSASLFAAGSNCNDDTSSLSGNGVAAPQIELTPPSYSFGDIQVGQCSGTYSFTLQNVGGGTATGTVSLTGANADQFEITSGSGSFSLGAGATQPISVRFCPTSTGAKSASLFADGSNYDDDTSSLSGGAILEGVNISVQPPTKYVGVGETFEVTIQAEAGDQPVSGIAAFVDFVPTYLEIQSVTPGTSLPTVTNNTYDNTAGTIDYVAGVGMGNPGVTGDFVLATIEFLAKAATPAEGTPLTFVFTPTTRETCVYVGADNVLDPSDAVNGSVTIYQATLLDGQVAFQGRPIPPHASWIADLTVTFLQGGMAVTTENVTTDNVGNFTIADVAPGIYDICVKSPRALSELETGVVMVSGTPTSADFGTSREGDANNDDAISLADYALLYAAYGSAPGDGNWNDSCDFNRNGAVDLADYALLYANYGQMGDCYTP